MALIVASDSPTVTASNVGRPAQMTGNFSSNGPGSPPPNYSPRSSLIWLAKMITAIPAVKPTVTG